MLFGVGVESPEDLRGSRLLEFDGCNESENIVPVVLPPPGGSGPEISPTTPEAAAAAAHDQAETERVELVLDSGCIREPQQMPWRWGLLRALVPGVLFNVDQNSAQAIYKFLAIRARI
jgi:hypothetical protein